jgi:hypothetical protein
MMSKSQNGIGCIESFTAAEGLNCDTMEAPPKKSISRKITVINAQKA